MNDSISQSETTLEQSSTEGQQRRSEASSRDRTRRCRERRRAGILVITVEIKPDVLEYLAHGTQTEADVLAGDRFLLRSAVERALAHANKKWREKAKSSDQ